MRLGILLAALFIATTSQAQWNLLDAHTTADFRGVDNVGHGIVWVSGSNGTILRSTDNGATWQHCTTPPDAAKLDFRGIQAFDANTAIAMSSGPGDASRLYKTTDGCQTWKLLITNPDRLGFWDALKFEGPTRGMILGDPVEGRFATFITIDGEHFHKQRSEGLAADPARDAIFAASNSSLLMWAFLAHRFFVTGGPRGAFFIECHGELEVGGKPEHVGCLRDKTPLPVVSGSASTGAFSLATHDGIFVTVGGDYTKPDVAAGTAAYSLDSASQWNAATTPPHGYRSAVAYDEKAKTWITVGPNGTDISTDDGRNWRPLTPTPAEPLDADKNWNALALPFVVGPHGRIGILNPSALKLGSPKSEAPHKN
jgi:hypothetical protein